MQLETTCWAQDLKNEGNDFFALSGEAVSVGDEIRSRQVVNTISNVTSNGRKHVCNSDLELYVLGQLIVLDASVLERDSAGRDSRIALHVSVPLDAGEDFIDAVTSDLKWFADYSGRTISPAAIAAIPEAIQITKKKWWSPNRPRNDQWIPFVLLGLLLFVVLAMLGARWGQACLTPLKPSSTPSHQSNSEEHRGD